MAWISSVPVFGPTINLVHSTGPQSMYALRRLLIQAGWTCPKDSDGLIYSPTGSQITHDGAGANGLDNNNAWFVLVEPVSGRQLLIQRGTLHYQWKVQYSKASGFVEGSPANTATPTAADKKFVNTTTDSYTTLFPVSSTYRFNAMAQDAAHNTVRAFSVVCRLTGTLTAQHNFLWQPTDSESLLGTDNDPIVMAVTSGSLTVGPFSSATTSPLFGYQRYGEVDEEWGRFALDYYSVSDPKDKTGSPYTTYPTPVDRQPVVRFSGTVLGWKGRMKYTAYVYDSSVPSWGDVIEMSDGSCWLVADEMAIAGWPDKTTVPLG